MESWTSQCDKGPLRSIWVVIVLLVQTAIDVVGRGELIYPTGVQLTISILLWPIECRSQNVQKCASGICNRDTMIWNCNNNAHTNKIRDLTVRNSVSSMETMTERNELFK